jgi:hypothetical protein
MRTIEIQRNPTSPAQSLKLIDALRIVAGAPVSANGLGGVLAGLLKLGANDVPRTVTMTSCNPRMQEINIAIGFKSGCQQPMALGSVRKGGGAQTGAETSNWLINSDWGGNGLTGPAEHHLLEAS